MDTCAVAGASVAFCERRERAEESSQMQDAEAVRRPQSAGRAGRADTRESEDARSGNDFELKTLRMVGFKALLAWHYLVLFSPLFFGGADSSPFLFNRQLVLYLSLAVAFGVLAIIGRPLLKRSKNLGPSRAVIVLTGAVSTLATVLPLVADGDMAARMAMTAFLGASEAVFMFLWLHYYRKIGARHLHRSFGFDMIWGGALAFVVCSLVPPAGYIAAVCLPVVATVSLVTNWRAAEECPVVDEGAIPSTRIWLRLRKGPRQNMTRQIMKTLVPVVMYSFVFGLIQGGYLVSDVTLLMANDSLVLLGVVAAGLVICLIPERSESDADIDLMHRFSLIFFVCGVVGIPVFSMNAEGLAVAEAAVLAGFNLFDFGSLILGIGLVRRMQPDLRLPIDGARPMVYIGLSIGLVAGYGIVDYVGGAGSDLSFLSICGIAVTMLVVTVVMPLRERVGCRYFSACTLLEKGISPEDLLAEDAVVEDLSAFRKAACAAQGFDVDRIDALVEVARNAEGEAPLPCLESPDKTCPALASGLEGASGQSEVPADEASREIVCPNCSATVDCSGESPLVLSLSNQDAASDTEPEGGEGSVSKLARSEDYARAKQAARAEGDKHDSPWRRTCREVAKLYRLSPRETEIFFLIAKGRNADFVQQKLVISMHTAKTHIANIYHKLGVHSSQEMLSLVEAFREEDIKAREKASGGGRSALSSPCPGD